MTTTVETRICELQSGSRAESRDNSDNTKRLNVEETKAKIASLEYIQNELKGIENIAK